MTEMYDKRIWINKTIELLKNNIDKIDWYCLSRNPNAIDLLEKELEDNPESKKIDWDHLSRNPNAIHILEKELKDNPNSNKIHWGNLSLN